MASSPSALPALQPIGNSSWSQNFMDELNTAVKVGKAVGIVQDTNSSGDAPSTLFGLPFTNLVLVVVGIVLVFGGIILLTAESAVSGVESIVGKHKQITRAVAAVA